MTKPYKNCQSCGMALNKSPNGGGTNANGTINDRYCAYCYDGGKFKNSDWTVDDMKTFVKSKMKEMGLPGFLAGMIARGIPRLERWRNSSW